MGPNNTPGESATSLEQSEKDSRSIHKSSGKKTLDVFSDAIVSPSQTQPEHTSRSRADSFLRRHGRMLSLFSKDSSLQFEPNDSFETFAFDAASYKVLVPLKWFEDERYTEEELEFANYHERAHFIDMRKNPDAYLENFHQMEVDAERLARKYYRQHPNKASLEDIKNFYYKELHAFYNCLDDIYVNDLVTSRVPFFNSGDGKDAIISLYEKLGFGNKDQTKQPLHRQLMYSLLRDAMVGKELGASEVDERVRAVLSKKVAGKTIQQLVNTELKTENGILIDPAKRYRTIRTLIQPYFLSLLEVAIDEKEKPSNDNKRSSSDNDEQQGGETGDGNDGFSSSGSGFDPFADQVGSDQLGEAFDKGAEEDDVIKSILEGMKEDKKMVDMSPQERADYQAKKSMQEFDEKNGVTPEERAENELVKSEIEEARRKMRKFWQNLIGKSIEYRTSRIQNQRRGRLNVNSFIDKYPEIIEAQENGNLREMEIYDRIGVERVVVDQPETIDVSLLIDCSGSMSGAREKVAKKAAALLMYSLKDFNDELERTRSQTHSKLRANSQVIAFGSSFEEVKPFEKVGFHTQSDVAIIKSISQINSERGGTDDASPLGWIRDGISEEEKDRIKSKKLKKIVFEITDGIPDDPKGTAQKIRILADEGVIVVGFQIGAASQDERDAFEQIWNGLASSNDQQNPIGIYVGEEIDSLPERLMTSLSSLLSDIVI